MPFDAVFHGLQDGMNRISWFFWPKMFIPGKLSKIVEKPDRGLKVTLKDRQKGPYDGLLSVPFDAVFHGLQNGINRNS